MQNNRDIAGIALLLVLLGSFTGPKGNYPSRPYSLRVPPINNLIGEFHRVVDVMDRVDSIGQYALKSPSASDDNDSKLPFPGASILPDMNNIMEVMAPLIKNFKG